MTDHLPWILLVLGLTYVVTESAIFMLVRVWLASVGGEYVETLLFCPACTGFWAGVLVSLFGFLNVLPIVPPHAVFWMPFASCAIGAVYGHFRGEHPTYHFESDMIQAARDARKATDG